MKVVLQRAKESKVEIYNEISVSISGGLVILLGIEEKDEIEDILWLINKIKNLRIFNDEKGVMNKSIQDVQKEFLVISQFTLHASTKKGNRPSYIKAAKSHIAIPLYNTFIKELRNSTNLKVATGIFGADMKVHLVNDGPVTIIIDSKNKE